MESELETATTEPWRRLHPASLWVNLVPQIWKTVRVLWPVLLATFFTGEGSGQFWVDLFVLALFFVVGLFRSIVHWLTLRYRMENGRLRIESGLLHRTSRIIDPQRIQNIERIRNLFHKAAGLAELHIETAGDSSTEGLLSAIHIHEAEALQAQLTSASRRADDDEVEDDDETDRALAPIARQSVPELIAFGATSRGIGALALLGFVAFEAIGIMGPEVPFTHSGTLAHAGFLLALLLLAIALSYAISILRALIKHWDFRLTAEPNRLVTTEGLTTRRRVEIPLRKIQLVRTDEPLVRRWMGFGTVHIETAGLGVTQDMEVRAEGVVPMVEHDSLIEFVRRAIPEMGFDPWSTVLRPAHPRALLRAFGIVMTKTTILVAIAAYFMGTWAILLFGFLFLSIPATWLDWRKRGWAIDERGIISRRGFFNRQTWLIPRRKLQSIAVRQTPGMRLHGLGKVVVRVAGTQVAMPEVSHDEAMAIFRELQKPTAGR